jgi:hypothetical protein
MDAAAKHRERQRRYIKQRRAQLLARERAARYRERSRETAEVVVDNPC